jgi:regulatory protein YycI of two-component signal transduction system YycFG
MRAFLFVVVVLILMGLLGWINFGRNSDRATINMETKMIENDLKRTADAVRDAAEQGVEKVKEAAQSEKTAEPPPP